MADHATSPGADLASASGESVANISEDLESSTNSVAARVVTPTLPLIGRLRMPTDDAPTHPAVPQSPFGPPERDFVPASPSIMSLSHLLEKFDNDDDDVVIYAGSGNPELAADIATQLGLSVHDAGLGRFNDGEIKISIAENVRGKHVFIIQSTCAPVNDNVMELLLMIRAFRRAHAKSITAVLPYFAYSRGDQRRALRTPIPASAMAVLLEAAEVDRVVGLQLHSKQVEGFFRAHPGDSVRTMEVFTNFLMRGPLDKGKLCIVSPSARRVHLTLSMINFFAKFGYESSMAVLIREAVGPEEVSGEDDTPAFNENFATTDEIIDHKRDLPLTVVGEEAIKNAHCVIVDDIAFTGNTIVASAESLKEFGADRVTVCVTHAVLSGKDSVENIVNSDAIDLFVCTDTIPVVNENRVLPECDKVVVLSVAELIAEVMLRVHYSGVPHKPGKRTPVSTPRQLHFDTEDNIG